MDRKPIAVKIGLGSAAVRLAWMRFLLGGLAILAYAWWTRHRGVFDVHPGEWRVLWSLGLLFAVQIGLMNVGIARTTATHAAVLVNSYAVHTVVLAHFFIPGDRLTAPKLGGIAIAYPASSCSSRGLLLPDGTLVGTDRVRERAAPRRAHRVHGARRPRLDPIKMLVFQAAIGRLLLLSARGGKRVSRRATRRHWPLAPLPGVVVAGFNFVMNMRLLQIYRPSALATCASRHRSSACSPRPPSRARHSRRRCSSRPEGAGIGLTTRPEGRARLTAAAAAR